MTAEQLQNLGVCGAGSGLGFNTVKGCADLLEAADAIWLIAPSVVIAATQAIDLAFIKSLQKAGNLIVIKDVSTFAENGNDDAIETLEDDTQIRTNKGKYKLLATFAKGLYYNRALTSIEGHGNWSTIIVDKKGDIFLTSDISGGHKGFTTGMIRPTKLAVASNTTSTKSGLEFQLLKRFELDENYVRYDNENLDFDPREVEAITQVFLSFVNAPANLDVILTVKAVVERGRKDAVTAALFSQFLNKVNGATVNPTGGDDSVLSGAYVLTGVTALATNDTGTFQMYDNANNSPIIEIAGDGLYRSNVIPYTVV